MNLINIALTGLNANRVALDVTAQNVANINTPGYTRQQAITAAIGGSPYDHTSAGGGVEVTSIRRISDAYMVKQVWATNTGASYAANFTTNMSMLENTLGGEAFNLSTGLDSLFGALNDATTKPESIPLRQQIINEAQALSRRFNTLNDSLHAQSKDINDQRNAAMGHANSLIENIAAVNQQIKEANGTGGNAAQLLDTRDHLVGELSKVIEIKTVDQGDGTLQITLGNGQPLVMGGDFGQLQAKPDLNDSTNVGMEVSFGKQTFSVASDLGGTIGALNDYQEDVLKPNQIAINDMAKNMADEFNAVLATGTDLNGNRGQPLFTYDPNNPAQTLTIIDLGAADLALSSDGTPGNSDVLKDLISINEKPFTITGFGDLTLNDAFSTMVGNTAITARQAKSDYDAQSAMNAQAVAKRDNVSAVSSDEEAANVMMFSNAHNANMKVISTANDLFNSVLQLF